MEFIKSLSYSLCKGLEKINFYDCGLKEENLKEAFDNYKIGKDKLTMSKGKISHFLKS